MITLPANCHLVSPVLVHSLYRSQPRESLHLCLAGLRFRWFDPVAEAAELFDCLPSGSTLKKLQNSTTDGGSAFVAPAGGAGEPRELHVAPMFEYTTYVADAHALMRMSSTASPTSLSGASHMPRQ